MEGSVAMESSRLQNGSKEVSVTVKRGLSVTTEIPLEEPHFQ